MSTYYLKQICSRPPPAPLGDLTFLKSPDHATATYDARVHPEGSATILLTIALGRPAPDVNGLITVNIAAQLTALGPGNYEVSVATTTAGGTTDSAVSNAFTVPLT